MLKFSSFERLHKKSRQQSVLFIAHAVDILIYLRRCPFNIVSDSLTRSVDVEFAFFVASLKANESLIVSSFFFFDQLGDDW